MEKRVKRRVAARNQEFFAVTAPGLEEVCAAELHALEVDSARTVPGGVEFFCKPHIMYAANLWLSTATRVLMRVARFTAYDFAALERAVEKIPWELYLGPKANISVRAASKKSKLIHTDAIVQRVEQSIKRHMYAWRTKEKTDWEKSEQNRPEPYEQELHVRALGDQFEISVDTSGQPLYQRGTIMGRAAAPLRETLAAGILRLAGYDGSGGAPLLDPMAGSGSFSMEAAFMVKKIPPGWFREFVFVNWPSFAPGRWKHLRRTALKEMLELDAPVIFTSDQNQGNAAQITDRMEHYEVDDAVDSRARDFFALEAAEISPSPGLIVLNPPYGLRMGKPEQAKQLFDRILTTLRQNFKGWKVAVMVPDQKWLSQKKLFKDQRRFGLLHGGLRITLVVGTVD